MGLSGAYMSLRPWLRLPQLQAAYYILAALIPDLRGVLWPSVAGAKVTDSVMRQGEGRNV